LLLMETALWAYFLRETTETKRFYVAPLYR